MHISKVSLVNYRNFANAFFIFNEGINTLIGENGSGKTNLFNAMRLLLEDSSYQFAYRLNQSDFNRTIDDWRGQWIIISIEFDKISKDEAIQSLFIHGFGKIEKKDFVDKASYNLFFRPKAQIRKKLSELKEGDKKGLDEVLNEINASNINEKYETIFTGKSTVNFNDPTIYKELVGNFQKVKFNFEIDSSKFGIRVPNQLSVAKEISFTFIKALRDVVSDFHNNRTNPLLQLLRSRSKEIKTEDFEPVANMVLKLNKGIESLPDVQRIRTNIIDTVKEAVGGTYSPSSLSIRSSLSEEADRLLQSLRLFIGEPDETYEGAIHELSLGGANLIFLTLKLLEYKYKSEQTFANFLLIEEPESHIHTHIQKTLFDKLEYGETQIIYSTHSPQISEISDVSKINILAKKQNYAEVFQPSIGLSNKSIGEIQRYLDAVRSNLLFAKGVILVEGDAEEILIPILTKNFFGISLDELGISLINIRSTGFENVAQLFDNKRIKRKCSIITDLDAEICDTKISSTESVNLIAYKTKIKNSAERGRERKNRLDDFSKSNDWLKPFYAGYTFEIDLIESGNEGEVLKTLNEIYSDPSTINKAKSELKSDDVSVYGKRILTMANHHGKGWYAILLGKFINYQTIIPEYILDAIIFAKASFSKTIIIDIINYRINENMEDDTELNFNKVINSLKLYRKEKVGLKEVIDEISKVIKDDQVIEFLSKL